ncbi:MAG: hypothetical protein N2053_08075 [Chitinispirillaceae bacterium]|nr:hypothetical protein [Chitinispirillaceae bacterium]
MQYGFILILIVFFSLRGEITYTLSTENSNTAEGKEAYARIKIAMDSAVYYYNTYTTLTKKLTVKYEPSVQTADGNYNGSIRFGPNKSYQITCTAMHEIAHTIGVGTTNEWRALINENKIYIGQRASAKLKEIDGPTAVLKGDAQHFWPYGLNYASEVKSEKDLINHCLIVNEIYKDMFPKSDVIVKEREEIVEILSLKNKQTGNSYLILINGKKINFEKEIKRITFPLGIYIYIKDKDNRKSLIFPTFSK